MSKTSLNNSEQDDDFEVGQKLDAKLWIMMSAPKNN